jgi:hypothetical protein
VKRARGSTRPGHTALALAPAALADGDGDGSGGAFSSRTKSRLAVRAIVSLRENGLKAALGRESTAPSPATP